MTSEIRLFIIFFFFFHLFVCFKWNRNRRVAPFESSGAMPPPHTYSSSAIAMKRAHDELMPSRRVLI